MSDWIDDVPEDNKKPPGFRKGEIFNILYLPAVLDLTLPQLRAALLVVKEEMTVREASELLQISTSACYRRLADAKKRVALWHKRNRPWRRAP